jgi:hypothetical protein
VLLNDGAGLALREEWRKTAKALAAPRDQIETCLPGNLRVIG